MSRANPELITALRKTAERLQDGAKYQWGHMGSCNCGHLAQEITHLSKARIHEYAMGRAGDWADQCLEFCPDSSYPMDLLITRLLEAGLDIDDLRHLERLSDKKILQRLPDEKRNLRHNSKSDVIIYLKTWADLLEEQLWFSNAGSKWNIPEITKSKVRNENLIPA